MYFFQIVDTIFRFTVTVAPSPDSWITGPWDKQSLRRRVAHTVPGDVKLFWEWLTDHVVVAVGFLI